MIASKILINRDLHTVWKQVEGEFCKAFKCSGSELKDCETKFTTQSFTGTAIDVIQKVIEYVPEQTIAIQSVNNHDIVVSRYAMEAVDTGTTIVTLSLDGKNKSSVLRSWNYWLMGLPILRNGTTNKLKHQLARLKTVIENEGA